MADRPFAMETIKGTADLVSRCGKQLHAGEHASRERRTCTDDLMTHQSLFLDHVALSRSRLFEINAVTAIGVEANQ